MKLSTKLTLTAGALLFTFAAGISGVLLHQTAWDILLNTRNAGYILSENVRYQTRERAILEAATDSTAFWEETFHSDGLNLPAYSGVSDYTYCAALVAFPPEDDGPETLIYREHMLLLLGRFLQAKQNFALVLDDYPVETWQRIETILEKIHRQDEPQLTVTATGHQEGLSYFYPSQFTLNGEVFTCPQNSGTEELTLTLNGWQCHDVRLNHQARSGVRLSDWKALFDRVDDDFLRENYGFDVKTFEYDKNFNEKPELFECYQTVETYIVGDSETVLMSILIRAAPLYTAWCRQQRNIFLLFASAFALILLFSIQINRFLPSVPKDAGQP